VYDPVRPWEGLDRELLDVLFPPFEQVRSERAILFSPDDERRNFSFAKLL